jgi:hypothetical protein
MTTRLPLRRVLALFFAALVLCAVAIAQSEDSQAPKLGSPQVIFVLDWAQADPPWYQIAVDSAGNASYTSKARVQADETPEEPYSATFTMSPKTRARIFELANATQHFKGSFDYKGSIKMAQTGIKTLKYEADGATNSTSYNWSEDKQIMELTNIFQGISTTMEVGRELRHAQRFDKLGVDAILRRLEELHKGNNALELQAISSILRRIANDQYSMNIARQRANRLLMAADSGQ